MADLHPRALVFLAFVLAAALGLWATVLAGEPAPATTLIVFADDGETFALCRIDGTVEVGP